MALVEPDELLYLKTSTGWLRRCINQRYKYLVKLNIIHSYY
jgi:hypothetical protein